MKLKLIIAAILLTIAVPIQAHVREVTGPFQPNHPPPAYRNWLNHYFQDPSTIHLANEFYPDGWDTNWIFSGPPQFVTTPLNNSLTTLSWIPTGYLVRWIFVSGPDPLGFGWINMYEVTGPDRYFGTALLTINSQFPITAVGIFGILAH
jgi:hypothetical protein